MNILSNIVKSANMFVKRHDYIYTIMSIIIGMFVFYNFSSIYYVDGVFAAFDFFMTSFENKLSDSQIIRSNRDLYKASFICRYIYYTMMNIVYFLISIIILNEKYIAIELLIAMTAIPNIFNGIIYHRLKIFFDFIKDEKSAMTKKICAEQLTNLMMQLSNIYIGPDFKINKDSVVRRLLDLKELETIGSNIVLFFQNFLLVTLMNYLKNNKRGYYNAILAVNGILGFSADLKTIDIRNINVSEAKNIFISLITNQKFDELTKSSTLQAIICLYYHRDNTETIKKLEINIKYKLLTISALWACVYFFSNCIIGTVTIIGMSSSLRLRRRYNVKSFFTKKYIASVILTILSLFKTDYYLIIAILSQFGGNIIFNPITLGICNVMIKNVLVKIIKLLYMMHANPMIYLKYSTIAMTCILFKNMPLNAYIIAIILNLMSVEQLLSSHDSVVDKDKKYLHISKYINILLYLTIINNGESYTNILLGVYVLSSVDNIINHKKYSKEHEYEWNKIVSPKINAIINPLMYNLPYIVDTSQQSFISTKLKDYNIDDNYVSQKLSVNISEIDNDLLCVSPTNHQARLDIRKSPLYMRELSLGSVHFTSNPQPNRSIHISINGSNKLIDNSSITMVSKKSIQLSPISQTKIELFDTQSKDILKRYCNTASSEPLCNDTFKNQHKNTILRSIINKQRSMSDALLNSPDVSISEFEKHT